MGFEQSMDLDSIMKYKELRLKKDGGLDEVWIWTI